MKVMGIEIKHYQLRNILIMPHLTGLPKSSQLVAGGNLHKTELHENYKIEILGAK